METIHQFYESLPETITVPQELRNRKAEIIIKTLEDESIALSDAPANGAMLDPDVLKFAGCLPDFPPREPQGEYEIREELH